MSLLQTHLFLQLPIMYLKLEAVTTCTFKQSIYNSVAFVNLFALVVICIYTDNKELWVFTKVRW